MQGARKQCCRESLLEVIWYLDVVLGNMHVSEGITLNVSERQMESQSQYHQTVCYDQHDTPTVRVVHYRPEDTTTTPSQPATDTDQESTTDTDHYDKPDELSYEGLDATTVTPPVVQQQPSVYQDLRP